MAALVYRDRTGEFLSIAARLRKGVTSSDDVPRQIRSGEGATSAGLASGSNGAQSEFNQRASKIGLAIHQTTQKLDKLAKLAKQTSMFNDPAVEIQELTAVVKQDITSLNGALEELQAVLAEAAWNSGGGASAAQKPHAGSAALHSNTVVESLKGRLLTATKSFKDVLTMRTQNLKLHEGRRQLFSANSPPSHSGGLGLANRGARLAASANAHPPPPWASSANGIPSTSSSSPSASQLFSQSTSSRRSYNPYKTSDPHDQQYQQQDMIVVQQQDGFMRSRSEALHSVESTIVELGTIFQRLAGMVQQQGELAVRIDHDVEDSLANVEGAQAALVQYLARISANRSLILKIFGILLLFLLIFVTFIA
eukprot:TRINITY_DN5224_c0_g1_i1.p1 TRINITY_DN5224_c0_g1~~TRINITY_DN5224_c0_g1_i1.p1  ORF type:complete len:366 (-),score=59.32 TRINITY_DN5224_c0_g1_i1:212-1309(-)